MNRKLQKLALGLCALSVTSALAGEWANWRGPAHNGSSPETDLPKSWSKTENVLWKAAMSGRSAATPIISGGYVFVSSTDEQTDELYAIALDRSNGKERWRSKVAKDIRRDDRSTYAASSPVTDGETVVFFFGNGELQGFDLGGHKRWERNIQDDYGDFAFQWTFSSSPVIYKGRLYLQVLQRNVPVRGKGKEGAESYLLAMNPKTGETEWKHVRPSDAYMESLEAFSTPVPYTHDGREELILVGGDCITGHNPVTGKEYWRWGTWNPQKIGHWRLVPSPAVGGGVALACAPKREPIFAVNLGGQGTLSDDDLAWVSDDNRDLSSDVPTPAFAEGDFFILSDVRNALSRVEPKTGKVKWTTELPRGAKYRSSPTVADGAVYFLNHDGVAFVVDSENGAIQKEIEMGKRGGVVRSSVAVSEGQLFIRTMDELFCIGSKSSVASR